MKRRHRLDPSYQAFVATLHYPHQQPVKKMLAAIQRTLDKLQDAQNAAPTEPVYHYTNRRGLDGITRSGNFRLTDYTQMSDTSEIQYGLDIGLKMLRENYANGAQTGRLTKFKNAVENAARRGLPKTLFRGFILSLTPKSDELTQWEIYGSRARGYAIGFSGRLLDRAYTAFKEKNGIESGGAFKVLYDEHRLRRLMRSHVRHTMSGILFLTQRGRVNHHSANLAMARAAVNLVFAFIFTALFFKHPAYKHEDEYRYFIMTLPDKPIAGLKTRQGRNNRVVDFYEFDWTTKFARALRTIKVGPAQDEIRGRTIVKRALARRKLKAAVSMSEIPRIDR